MAVVSTKHRAVVLKSRYPERVLQAIPHAKRFEHSGHDLLAIPHKLDETRVLRNLGFKIPEPIRHYYRWPGRFKPFHAQTETAAFLTMHPRAYVFNALGTGKTLASIWAADYLMRLGVVEKVLIVATLSTLERTWADSIFETLPTRVAHVLHGTRSRRMKLLADTSADYYIINTDGVNIVAAALAERPDINLIIVDEGALFRTPGTDRWKSLNAIVNRQAGGKRMCWWLTGSPTPSSPVDAWGQAKICTPWTAPGYVGGFKRRVMDQVSQWRWVPKPGANDVVAEVLQPSIRFRMEDCVDLPPTIMLQRSVPLTDVQAKAYKEMLSTLQAELEDGTLNAANEAVKLGKLFQIATGSAYDRDREVVDLPMGPRLEELENLIEQSAGKVLVFAHFKPTMRRIAAHLAEKYTVGVVNGETSKHERDEIFSAFQKRADPHVLVMQPASAAHGLTLTAASTIVWFGPITSNEFYEQANGRVRRPGQTRTTVIVQISSTAEERRQYARLADKGARQGSLLDIIRESKVL